VFIDSELRTTLDHETASLKAAATAMMAQPTIPAETKAIALRIQQDFVADGSSLQVIENHRAELGGSAVREARQNASLVSDLLNRSISGGRALTSEEMDAISVASKNVQAIAETASHQTNPNVEVIVRTRSASRNEDVPNLEVFSVNRAYDVIGSGEAHKSQFLSVSSPARGILTRGVWVIWTVQSGSQAGRRELDLTTVDTGQAQVDMLLP